MADRVPKWSLKSPTFNVPVADIQFKEYKPQQEDFNLLANSIRQREERQLAATQKLSEFDAALAKYRERLHQDNETLTWFDDFANKYRNQINDFARYGDYGNAITSAIRLAGEAARNPELIDRLRTNEDYETWRKGIINNNTIGQTTKDRILAHKSNQYTFTPKFDDDGNIIGGARWEAKVNPVATVNRVELAKLAAQLAAPEQGSTTGPTYREGKDKTPENAIGSSGYQYQRLTTDKINEVFKGVFQQIPGAEESLMQDYADDVWRLKKAEQELELATDEFDIVRLNSEIESIKDRLYDGNSIRDPRSYMAKAMGFIIPNMSYNYVTTSQTISLPSANKTNNPLNLTGLPHGFDANNTFRTVTGGTVMHNWSLFGQQATTGVGQSIQYLRDMYDIKYVDGKYVDSQGNQYKFEAPTGTYKLINSNNN